MPGPELTREERFTALARDVAEPLLRYALRRTDPETAHDVVADTLLVLWRRLDDVPTDAVLPWSYAVARGCLANARRAAGRRRRLVERLGREPVADEPALDDEPLHRALAALSDVDREVVRLWAWESLQPSEIAAVLGITPNAVSIRLHRARRKLAASLAASGKKPSAAGQEQVEERRP